MNFIQNSDCSFFDKTRFIKNQTLMKQLPFYAQGLLDLGIKRQSIVLIQIDDVFEQMIAIFSLLYLECTICLLNKKMPKDNYDFLIKELGKHQTLSALPPLSKKSCEGFFNLKKTSFLVATSASTSFPKLICLTLDGFFESAKDTCLRFLAKSSDTWLLSLPLFHVSGLSVLFRALVSNAILVIDEPFKFYQNLRVSFVPSLLEKLDQKVIKPHFLKAKSLLIGGGKLNQNLLDRFPDFPIYITYGMTEAYSQISMSHKSPQKVNEGSVMGSKQLKINQSGAIFIKGLSCATHRFSCGDMISILDEEGYIATKDVALYDNNQITILGREDERIEKMGEKIYPSVLESIITKILRNKTCFVTHIKKNDKIIVGAFLEKIPNADEKKQIKDSIGTLFFPDAFLEIPTIESGLKINLKTLKNKLLETVDN